jgi:2-polyprenyl-3-methyl-5-hydroxy-6-metoxy-1,4-benzoquinol methylase
MKRLVDFLARLKKRGTVDLPKPLEFVYLNWNKLGQDDPLWAISSQADKKDGKWALDDFFAEGTGTLQFVFDEMKARGVEPRTGRALDFGCGVGRLTQALAARFSRVDGVDFADTMIENANRLNRFSSRCKYHLNHKPDLSLFRDQPFDFVFTLITL